MKPRLTPTQIVIAGAVFIVAFSNLAFFRHVFAAFVEADQAYLQIGSLGLVLLCLTVALLSLLALTRAIKPVFSSLFLLSAATAYFMDTYNVVIDRDMLVNAASTDAAETAEAWRVAVAATAASIAS